MKYLILIILFMPLLSVAQYQNDFLFEEPNEVNVYGLDTIGWSFNQDSLVIKERFYSYDPPFSKHVGCAVYGCKDDHITYYIRRTVYWIELGEISFGHQELFADPDMNKGMNNEDLIKALRINRN